MTISRTFVIIPVRNEEESIGKVLSNLLDLKRFEKNEIFVSDNGSIDRTSEIVKGFGVNLVSAPVKGYGSACLAALAEIQNLKTKPDWILFLDGDGSDEISEYHALEDAKNSGDLVIGSRVLGLAEPGSLQFIQRYGNAFTCALLKIFFKQSFTDLGPFRLIKYSLLQELAMKDLTWGWNIEMQIKALQVGAKVIEIPVRYKKRFGGKSKISGNLIMSIRVGLKILWVFASLLILRK